MASNSLDSVAGWAASAALCGILVIPLFIALAFVFRPVVHRCEPLRLGYYFIKATPPILAL